MTQTATYSTVLNFPHFNNVTEWPLDPVGEAKLRKAFNYGCRWIGRDHTGLYAFSLMPHLNLSEDGWPIWIADEDDSNRLDLHTLIGIGDLGMGELCYIDRLAEKGAHRQTIGVNGGRILTPNDIEAIRTAKARGYHWLAKQESGLVMAFRDEPIKYPEGWYPRYIYHPMWKLAQSVIAVNADCIKWEDARALNIDSVILEDWSE